ncbi:hypothetical protein [Jeotgalibaca arthritidis]|uniref:Uncharacterized protein n=1 Tax=Jeotgalibaca arthritidis TaxID=1868794 RepID=A0A6G7KAA2_9LACT|nr:hypothetical protein [Jeotgalibaca arthritidis]QII82199.1 hypothetical protein G7057_06970 [Jeotgalibaca arthritidis]
MTVVHEEGDDFATWISVSPLVHELALMGDELGAHSLEDKVVTVENAYGLINLLEFSERHVFGRCGHWTLIEKSQDKQNIIIQKRGESLFFLLHLNENE